MQRAPTELELKVLQRLWDMDGQGTVHSILQGWVQRPVPQYTTVLKILQIMEEKGFVRHAKDGRSYRYIARLKREDLSRHRLGELLRGFYKGDRLGFVNALVDELDLSAQEISDVRAMLAEKAKEKQA
jgi:BlaI family transcriptional regulator, penicillinase repressor